MREEAEGACPEGVSKGSAHFLSRLERQEPSRNVS